jgi:hypothetical protein
MSFMLKPCGFVHIADLTKLLFNFEEWWKDFFWNFVGAEGDLELGLMS